MSLGEDFTIANITETKSKRPYVLCWKFPQYLQFLAAVTIKRSIRMGSCWPLPQYKLRGLRPRSRSCERLRLGFG